jgi:hypothetical protein
MCTALYEAARVLLTRTQKWSCSRLGHAAGPSPRGKKAIVALARRLAVPLHQMWTRHSIPLAQGGQCSSSLKKGY